MSNTLIHTDTASHEITKAIDLSPRLVMTRNGIDDTDPLRVGYLAGTTKHYTVCAIEPGDKSVRLSFSRRDCQDSSQLPNNIRIEMNFARKDPVKLLGVRRRDVPEEVLAFASLFTVADHLIERLDFHREAAELEEYIGRHFKAMIRRTRKIPAIERKLAALRTASTKAA